MGVSEPPSASVRNNEMSEFGMINDSIVVREIASLVVSPKLVFG